MLEMLFAYNLGGGNRSDEFSMFFLKFLLTFVFDEFPMFFPPLKEHASLRHHLEMLTPSGDVDMLEGLDQETVPGSVLIFDQVRTNF